MGLYLGPFRITKRGVRVRIGPRAARLHIGAGEAGISTGAGPFTWYHRLSGAKRRRATARRSAPPRHYAQPPDSPQATALHPTGYGRAVQPPGPRKPEWWTHRRIVVVSAVSGSLAILVLIAGLAGYSPAKTPASHNVPAAVTSRSPATPDSPAVADTTSPAAVTQAPAPSPTTQAPAPVTTTMTAAPPPPLNCHPLTSTGHCYEPGEYCPTADAGMTGVAGDGETIVCILESGRYHWHPTS